LTYSQLGNVLFPAADFRVNLFLKELKRQNNKEKKAPAPHRKEKNKKEKVQKTTYTTKEGAANMEARQKAFWETPLSETPRAGTAQAGSASEGATAAQGSQLAGQELRRGYRVK
jgi:hypothetical protein